jgi:iduronate 2-sulfatase
MASAVAARLQRPRSFPDSLAVKTSVGNLETLMRRHKEMCYPKFCLMMLVGCSMVATLCKSAQSAADPPNVLFIAVDDLNDWISATGPAGHPDVQTPHLDRLVKRGVYFSNAHTAVPVCMASRLALMSGLSAASTGHYSNFKVADESLLRQTTMLPAYLRKHGYKTMGGGKLYHHGTDSGTDSPDWDVAKPMYEMSKAWRQKGHNYGQNFFQPFPKGGSPIIQKHGRVSGYSLCGGPLDPEDMPRGIMPDEELADWAVGQLKEKHDSPFFLAVGFARPHVPYTAPRKYFELYDRASLAIPDVPDDEFTDIPVFGKVMALCTLPGGDHWFVLNKMGPDYWRELVHAYLACVSFIDDQIGQVLKALDESPYAKNTLIVLWSDHGQHLGEKKHWRKMCLWEESTHVPLLWVLPDGRNAGRSCANSVSLLDVYPTLVDLLNLPPIDDNEGQSLVGLLAEPESARVEPAVSTWYYKNHSVRSRLWRYICYRDGTEELYDHRSDPDEHENLADDPAYAQALEEHRKWLPKSDATFSVNPTMDSLGKRAKEWDEDNSQIPDWLK